MQIYKANIAKYNFLPLSFDSGLKYGPGMFLTGLVRFTPKGGWMSSCSRHHYLQSYNQEQSQQKRCGCITVSFRFSSADMYLSIMLMWHVIFRVLSIFMISKAPVKSQRTSRWMFQRTNWEKKKDHWLQYHMQLYKYEIEVK